MPSWEFVYIKHSPQGDQSPTDPNACYTWSASKVGSNERAGASCCYHDLELVMNRLGVDQPRKLVGQRFESPGNYTEATMAFDYFLTYLRHSGIYLPPCPDEIYDRIVDALARMECPDFSDVDWQTILLAVSAWYQTFEIIPARFQWLKDEVNRRSSERVEIELASPADFQVSVQGMATFLRLITNDDRVQKFVLAPARQPVIFDN